MTSNGTLKYIYELHKLHFLALKSKPFKSKKRGSAHLEPSNTETIQTALYTIWTNGNGTLNGWSDIETAVAFISHSATISRQHFKKVILYTDSFGKSLFNKISFDEIIVSLDEFDVDPGIKGACKLDTYIRQSNPFVHFDWDFILWQRPANNLTHPAIALNNRGAHPPSDLSLIWKSLPWRPAFIDSIIANETPLEVPHTALFGGSDLDFVKWYSELALEIVRHPKNQFLQKLARSVLAKDICIAIERWLLAACAQHRGIDIHYFNTVKEENLDSADASNIPRLGYTHLSQSGRDSDYWKAEIKKRVYSNIPQGATEIINLNSIPYRALISLDKCGARRSNALRQFKEEGFDVKWKIPVPLTEIDWGVTSTMYADKPSSASHALTLISILDEVESTGADNFILFEDDVVLHHNFSDLLAQIRFPADWKFIYLGGRNCGVKQSISRGVVSSTFAVDLHAVIMRSDIIPDIKRVLLDPWINSIYLDFRIASLHKQYPAYLCRPNLAWQSTHTGDDGVGIAYSNYNDDGTVKIGQGD